MKRLLASMVFAGALLVLTLDGATGQQGSRLVPTNLKTLNTDKDEDDPYSFTSRDGRVQRLYYASNASGRFALLQATQNARGGWQPGEALEGPDDSTDNRSPCLTPDGHDLYFASKISVKPAEQGAAPPAKNFDIVHAIELTKPTQFTAATPVLLVCTEADELHPWITADGKDLFFSRKTKEGWRVFVASRPESKGAFGEPKLVDDLPAGFHHATITSDGRTMFLQGPLAGDRWGLFRSRRTRKAGGWTPWSEPQELSMLNSPAEEAPVGDMSPCLSRDDRRLYFSSDRKGGKGGRDLWMINAPGLISAALKTKPK
jgi:hypothetical protein